MKYVETNGREIVAVYDSEYGKVPETARPISDDDHELIRAEKAGFGLFDFVDGRVAQNAERAQAFNTEAMTKAFKRKSRKAREIQGVLDDALFRFAITIGLQQKQINGETLTPEEEQALSDTLEFCESLKTLYQKESEMIERLILGER